MTEQATPAASSNPDYYCYYDSREGHDIDKKMFCCARYGALTGSVMAAYDILMFSHATSFRGILNRYMFHVLPLTAIGVTFAAVANSLVLQRKKNDALNYFLGGLACGPIVAYYVGSGHGVVLGGLTLGVAGVVKKTAIDDNVTLLPPQIPPLGSAYGGRTDYSFLEDPKICCNCDNKNK